MNEFMETTLVAALIILVITNVIYLIKDSAGAKQEREDTKRRLDDIEAEMKEIREVHSTLGEINANLQHIMSAQKEATATLKDLSQWQAAHQGTIDDAKNFIHESYRDGVRTKE